MRGVDKTVDLTWRVVDIISFNLTMMKTWLLSTARLLNVLTSVRLSGAIELLKELWKKAWIAATNNLPINPLLLIL
jgi:hypothetical protein